MAPRITEAIRTLREAPYRVRRRWLILFSAGAMGAVLFLWVLYIQVLIPVTESEADAAEPTFARTWSAGVDVVGGTVTANASRALSLLRRTLGRPHAFTVTPGEKNFILEELEPVPYTPFPNN